MINFFKNNKTYCLCQLFGTLLFFGIFLLFALVSEQPENNEVNIAAIFKTYVLIILVSHFVIRKIIKAETAYSQFNFKKYIFAILSATIVLLVLEYSTDYIFSPFFDPLTADEDPKTIVHYINMFLSMAFVFVIWCILYLSITSIRDKKNLNKQLQEQQLASLMNQINPHFLFNSLNTIRGMIYEDQDKAAELITQFSSLFRYNLSLERKKTTSLGEELRLCQQYLAIEAIRLGERLKKHIDVPLQHHYCKIPVMGLFTLVENAIKHGIAHLQQGGELSIAAKLENDMLVIEVANPYDESLVKSGTQIGLKNLQKRTQILFSGQGHIMQDTDNKIFKVTLRLPYTVIENV